MIKFLCGRFEAIKLRHQAKLESMLVVGLPGVYKLVIFYLIQESHTVSALGDVASWLSVAQIIGFLTVIGWASLILVRVPKVAAVNQASEFVGIVYMSVVTLVFCLIAINVLGYFLNKSEVVIQVSFWLVAWTFYQLPRHYCVAIKSNRAVIVFDVSIIASSSFLIFFVPTANLSLALSMVMSFFSCLWVLIIQKDRVSAVIKRRYDLKGLEFGATNLLSGGLWLSLVPLANILEGKEFAGILSIYVAATAFVLLVPRAISISFIPRMAACVDVGVELNLLVSEMKRYIFASNIFSASLSVLVSICIMALQSQSSSRYSTAVSFFLLTALIFITNQLLVSTNFLMARECSRYMMRSNFIMASLYVFAVCVVFIFVPPYGFNFVCVAYLLLNVFRLYFFNRKISRFIC